MTRRRSRRLLRDVLPRLAACILGLAIGIGFGELCTGIMHDSDLGTQRVAALASSHAPARQP